MSQDIGWCFPSSGGGTEAGFNDSGIETYAGKPFESLAREVIQNSLDAAASLDTVEPVTVSFELEEISAKSFPGRDEMLAVMRKCSQASKGDDKAEKFFARAVKILQAATIKCLKVSDYHTTGLRDGRDGDTKSGQWHRLVKTTGRSAKDSKTAGGSYGIGKNAPFAVSDLRTVFYSTRYKDSGGMLCERAQGKAILVSHPLTDDDDSQAVGFYGQKEKCARLTGDEILPPLRRVKDDGTTLLIPGLGETDKWQERIIAAVISNYFHAIDEGKLVVLMDHPNDDYNLIDKETMPRLLADPKIQKIDEDVRTAHDYYHAVKTGECKNSELPTLGHCTLWLMLQEDCPQTVAILRRGMKITDKLKGLMRWVSCSDFVAVCICKSADGNALLRDMENPAHDNFEPARLGVAGSLRGKRALKELADWIRREIKDLAESKIEKSVALSKMKDLFPAPDDNLPGENAEKDFDGGSAVVVNPVKIRPEKPDDLETDEEDGPGDDEGDFPGDSGGEGEGEGGSGSGGGSGEKKRISEAPMKVDAVRVLSLKDGTDKRVMFTPGQTGAASLSLKVAGDSFTEDIGGVAEVLDGDVSGVVDGKVLLFVEAGKRVSLDVRLANSFDGALSLVLGSRKEKSDEVDS